MSTYAPGARVRVVKFGDDDIFPNVVGALGAVEQTLDGFTGPMLLVTLVTGDTHVFFEDEVVPA
jgi:hypothetical protein